MQKIRQIHGNGLLVILILGVLTAFDSLGIDMYLPAFGAMESDFDLPAGTMSISLSAFMIGLAIGQGACGPLADRFGRKLPLFAGIVLFSAASALAALAPTFEVLVTARFLQGLGGSAGLVIPRTITSDLFDEKKSASVFTILMQVQSVSPLLAPVLGAYLLTHVTWHGIFWMLAFCGALYALAILLFIPETAPQRAISSPGTALSSKNSQSTLRELLRCRRYWLMTLSFSALMGALFCYISASSFIYVTLFGATATEYSLYFGLNSLGDIIFGLVSLQMLRCMPLARVLGLSFLLHVVFVGVLFAASLAGLSGGMLCDTLIFLAIASMGLLFGALTSEVMYAVPHALAGSASAILGVLQYAAASVAGILIGLLKAQSLLPIAGMILAFSLAAALLWIAGSRIAKPHIMRGESILRE